MKISVDDWEKLGRPPIRVRLNGEIIDKCTFADEENGIVEILRTDLIEEGMESIPTEELRGEVKITIFKDAK